MLPLGPDGAGRDCPCDPYLLSPAEPEAFLEAVNRMVLAKPELREG
ncbi:MAG: hypothetical protein AB1426_03905 [Bacillota bacterium]